MSKFNYTHETLHKEVERLYALGSELPSELFEKSALYTKILELKTAINLLDKYVFKEVKKTE